MKRLVTISALYSALFWALFSALLLAAPPAPADESPLKVSELSTCLDVVERACQAPARSFAADVSSVFCLSRIDGATGDAFVTHVWSFEGKEVRRAKLPVKTSSYRTWSSKQVKGLPGTWKVEVLDPLDRSIGVVEFVVERPKGGP
jgi:hypothetical protein